MNLLNPYIFDQENTLTAEDFDNETQTTTDFSIQASKKSTIYYGVFPTADGEHTKGEILAGTGALDFGSYETMGGVSEIIRQEGLTAGTAYKTHYYAIDDDSNETDVIVSEEFTTLSASSLLTNLEGSWLFDVFNDAQDATSNNRDLTYNQDVSPSINYAAKLGSKATESYSNDWTDTDAVYNADNSWTYAQLFRGNALGSLSLLAGVWGSSGNRSWRVYYSKGTGTFTFNISTSGTGTTHTLTATGFTESMVSDDWVTVLFGIDKENDVAFIRVMTTSDEGTMQTLAFTGSMFSGGSHVFSINNDYSGNKGKQVIQNVNFWSKALDDDEQLELWSNGRSLKYPFNKVPAANLPSHISRFVVFPDTQHAVEVPTVFDAMSMHVADNKEHLGYNMTLHCGDLRHKTLPADPDTPNMWADLLSFFGKMEARGILNLHTHGNHDWDEIGLTGGRALTEYHAHFDQDFYTDQDDWSGVFYDSTNENYICATTLAGEDYAIVSLEPVPRDVVLAWAANLIATTYSDHKIIYITHSILDDDGTFQDGSETNSMVHPDFDSLGDRNGGTDQYNTLLKPYANSRFTFNGHILGGGNATRINTGDEGNRIIHVARNYQEYDVIIPGIENACYFVLCTVNSSKKTLQLETYNVARHTFDWPSPDEEELVLPSRHNKTISYDENVAIPDTTLTFDPLDSETGVAVDADLTITTNHHLFRAAGAELKSTDLANHVELKEDNESGDAVAFTATINGTKNQITVSPSSNLDATSTYYLRVYNVYDNYGNALSSEDITFTTA